MSKLILANDGIDAVGKSLLEKAGFTVVTEKVAQENLASEINAKNYVALTVRSATKVRKDVIDACPNLKLIGRGGVGMDNIDLNHAKQKGIKVINTPASSSISVAELVFAHLFSGIRFLQYTNRMMPSINPPEIIHFIAGILVLTPTINRIAAYSKEINGANTTKKTPDNAA
jgi:D-3-phosphoglycerate dehydrogenase